MSRATLPMWEELVEYAEALDALVRDGLTGLSRDASYVEDREEDISNAALLLRDCAAALYPEHPVPAWPWRDADGVPVTVGDQVTHTKWQGFDAIVSALILCMDRVPILQCRVPDGWHDEISAADCRKPPPAPEPAT